MYTYIVSIIYDCGKGSIISEYYMLNLMHANNSRLNIAAHMISECMLH